MNRSCWNKKKVKPPKTNQQKTLPRNNTLLSFSFSVPTKDVAETSHSNHGLHNLKNEKEDEKLSS